MREKEGERSEQGSEALAKSTDTTFRYEVSAQSKLRRGNHPFSRRCSNYHESSPQHVGGGEAVHGETLYAGSCDVAVILEDPGVDGATVRAKDTYLGGWGGEGSEKGGGKEEREIEEFASKTRSPDDQPSSAHSHSSHNGQQHLRPCGQTGEGRERYYRVEEGVREVRGLKWRKRKKDGFSW